MQLNSTSLHTSLDFKAKSSSRRKHTTYTLGWIKNEQRKLKYAYTRRAHLKECVSLSEMQTASNQFFHSFVSISDSSLVSVFSFQVIYCECDPFLSSAASFMFLISCKVISQSFLHQGFSSGADALWLLCLFSHILRTSRWQQIARDLARFSAYSSAIKKQKLCFECYQPIEWALSVVITIINSRWLGPSLPRWLSKPLSSIGKLDCPSASILDAQRNCLTAAL